MPQPLLLSEVRHDVLERPQPDLRPRRSSFRHQPLLPLPVEVILRLAAPAALLLQGAVEIRDLRVRVAQAHLHRERVDLRQALALRGLPLRSGLGDGLRGSLASDSVKRKRQTQRPSQAQLMILQNLVFKRKSQRSQTQLLEGSPNCAHRMPTRKPNANSKRNG